MLTPTDEDIPDVTAWLEAEEDDDSMEIELDLDAVLVDDGSPIDVAL